eukprot:c13217_g1_i1.p3 GENE.c13217_g1_i1~~c13217_g1_i1.p3  ORF type:complete len:141 (-),score=28.76 c13217_g1_i1:126-548(-)
MPLSNRDMVYLVTFTTLPGGKIMLAERTIEHPSCPVTKKFVRMRKLNGFILSPHADPSGPATHVVIFAKFDIGGSIPQLLLGQFVTDTNRAFEDWTKFLASPRGKEIQRAVTNGLVEASTNGSANGDAQSVDLSDDGAEQ